MRLEDKVAVVTGGGTGIGRAAAKALAEEGARVFINGRREEKLRTVAEGISAPHAVRYIAADVGDREEARRLVEQVLEECGRLDILVNNHGINVPKRTMAKLSPDDWDDIMRVNVTGAFNTMHYALPGMRDRHDGVIICTSSIAGCRPSALAGVAYCASKHAMTALTRTISEEEKDSGIRLTVISPGEVETELLDVRPEPVSKEHRARILQPEDIASAIVFVATLPPRAHIPDLVMKPTTQGFA